MGLLRTLIAGVLLTVASVASGGQYSEAAPRADASEMAAFFHDDLAPYGKWVDHRIYGIVWVPDSGTPDWHPYAHGRWVWTSDYGWYWDSREPYGWATYHYGRWALTSDYGWVWVPGSEWGPAWVDWRYGGGHVGWAPMPPEWGPRHDDYRRAKSGPEAEAWIFVSEPSFVAVDVGRHRAPLAGNADLLVATSRVTNYAMVDGRIVNQSIEVGRIAAAANTSIAPAALVPANSAAEQVAAGAKGTVAVYRPVVLGGSQLGAPATLELGVPTDDTSVDVDPDALAKAKQKLDAKPLAGEHSVGGSFESSFGGTVGADPTPRVRSNGSTGGGLGVSVPGVGGLGGVGIGR